MIREIIWTRLIGVFFGLLVGVPVSWAAWKIAVDFNDVRGGLVFASFAAVPLAGSLWLLAQVLNRTSYYVAMDEERYYRRWGPRRLDTHRLEELGRFIERRGAVFVEHIPTMRKLLVIKSAYSPETVTTLAARFNAWRAAPPELRKPLMGHVNFVEAREARRAANQRIVGALRIICLLPLLIVMSQRFGNLRGAIIVFTSILIIGAAISLVIGVVNRLMVPRLKPVGEGEPFTDSISRD